MIVLMQSPDRSFVVATVADDALQLGVAPRLDEQQRVGVVLPLPLAVWRALVATILAVADVVSLLAQRAVA